MCVTPTFKTSMDRNTSAIQAYTHLIICMAKRNINWALAHRFQLQIATFATYIVVIVPDAIWLTMSHENAMSRLMEKPRLVTWK